MKSSVKWKYNMQIIKYLKLWFIIYIVFKDAKSLLSVHMEEFFTLLQSEMEIVLKKLMHSHMYRIIVKFLEEEKAITNLFSYLTRLL